jgi:hypothetical protein
VLRGLAANGRGTFQCQFLIVGVNGVRLFSTVKGRGEGLPGLQELAELSEAAEVAAMPVAAQLSAFPQLSGVTEFQKSFPSIWQSSSHRRAAAAGQR